MNLKRKIDPQTDSSLVEYYWRFSIQRCKFSPLTWTELEGCSCVSGRLAPWWEIAPTTQLTAPIICQSPARPTRSRWCQFPLRIELSAWLSVIERCIGVWKDDTGPLEERLRGAVGGAQELLSNTRAHSHAWLHYWLPSTTCWKFLYFGTTKINIMHFFLLKCICLINVPACIAPFIFTAS